VKGILCRHNLGGRTGCCCVRHANQGSYLKNPSLFNFHVLELSKHYQTQVLHPSAISHHNKNSTFTSFTAPQDPNFANLSWSFTNRACKGCEVICATGYSLRQLTAVLLSVAIQLSLSLAQIYGSVSAEITPLSCSLGIFKVKMCLSKYREQESFLNESRKQPLPW